MLTVRIGPIDFGLVEQCQKRFLAEKSLMLLLWCLQDILETVQPV